MTLSLTAESHDECDCLYQEVSNNTEVPHPAFGQPKENDDPPISRDTMVSIPSTPRKKRRLLPLTLSICYTLLMLAFWIITAILCFRPIKGSGWYDSYSFFNPCYFQDAGDWVGFLCKKSMESIELHLTINERWRRMTRMLSSILSVAAIPISSAICSRGAVVYLQNRKQQSFQLYRAITLADQGWSNPSVLGSMFLNRKKHTEINRYLLFSTLICALGALIWPLEQLLVTATTVQLVTGPNSPVTHYIPDADIAGLSQVASIDTISTTRAAIDMSGYWDTLPKLWRADYTDTCDINSATSVSFNPCNSPDYGFVSNIVNSVNTGVVQNHSFRFNSSTTCTNITENEYPRPCPGFTTSSIISKSSEDEKQIFEICAPGDIQKFPWNITRNRQDLEEEVYIYFNKAAATSLLKNAVNTSQIQRCTTTTTAGYFSLPNYTNPDFGPLLEEFNLTQSSDTGIAFYPPGTVFLPEDWHIPADIILGDQYPIPSSPESPAIGPLLTATMSLFGPSTFFSRHANATGNRITSHASSADVDNCSDVIPFYYLSSNESYMSPYLYHMNLCASTDPSAYSNDLRGWLFDLFIGSEDSLTELTFTQAVFFANQANLEQAASMSRYRRIIVIDPGVQTQRLEAHPASIAILSIIIALHLAGVIGVAYYAAQTPTWTATLDTFAMLQLGLNR